jgi:hypothetical protein
MIWDLVTNIILIIIKTNLWMMDFSRIRPRSSLKSSPISNLRISHLMIKRKFISGPKIIQMEIQEKSIMTDM